MPGRITRVAGFQGAVCKPREERAIYRVIRAEADPLVHAARQARGDYERAVGQMITGLNPQDFEQLIDLILTRTSWTRISRRGGSEEGFDIEAENLAAGETAFVQVKSEASQAILDHYISRFTERRDRYDRMIFAVHKINGRLTAPPGLPVQVWTGDRLADLVVRLGLGEWVEHKLV